MSAKPQPQAPDVDPSEVAESYDLFICHNRADKPVARELGAVIEGYDWQDRPLRVFLDEWDIAPGENIIVRLNDALDRARYVAVLLSPEMVSSEWCQAELASVLASDPTNRRGRLVPLLVRDKHESLELRLNIPPFLRALNRLDLRDPKRRQREYQRLVALLRGDPTPRGARARRGRPSGATSLVPALPERGDAPDEVEENLISNLLLVSELPSSIWVAPTALRRLKELPAGVRFPPFIPREGNLITFTDPSDPNLASLLTGAPRRFSVQEWRADPVKWRWVVELLNRSLSAFLYEQGVRFDMKHDRYYFGARGEKPVRLKWGIGKSRAVVRPPDKDKGSYWVHHAARIRIESFGSQLYLAIDPTYMFSTDGRTAIKREAVPGMAARWGGRERNRSILLHVLLWADVLTQGRARGRIPCGGQFMAIERVPRTVSVPAGLSTDRVNVEALLVFTQGDEPPDTPDRFGFEGEEGDDQ